MYPLPSMEALRAFERRIPLLLRRLTAQQQHLSVSRNKSEPMVLLLTISLVWLLTALMILVLCVVAQRGEQRMASHARDEMASLSASSQRG